MKKNTSLWLLALAAVAGWTSVETFRLWQATEQVAASQQLQQSIRGQISLACLDQRANDVADHVFEKSIATHQIDQLVTIAAERVVQLAAEAIAENGRFTIALAGVEAQAGERREAEEQREQ